MDAKEYLKKNDIPNEVITIQRDGFIEGHNLYTLLESYHQAKLKEISDEDIADKSKEYFGIGINSTNVLMWRSGYCTGFKAVIKELGL
jgi:hypothetical protein